MKILYSPASPYSAKVRMAASRCGIDVETASVIVNTNDDPALLIGSNPLGKIPTLITDDGQAIFDSRAIMQYLNRENGGKLYPDNGAARTSAEVLEALCDGITDCLIAHIYERRFRPEEKVHQPWLDKQWAKVERGLEHLQNNPPAIEGALHGGHFSLAAMIGYLGLRFAGQWEERYPALLEFAEEFSRLFPAYAVLRPQ